MELQIRDVAAPKDLRVRTETPCGRAARLSCSTVFLLLMRAYQIPDHRTRQTMRLKPTAPLLAYLTLATLHGVQLRKGRERN